MRPKTQHEQSTFESKYRLRKGIEAEKTEQFHSNKHLPASDERQTRPIPLSCSLAAAQGVRGAWTRDAHSSVLRLPVSRVVPWRQS